MKEFGVDETFAYERHFLDCEIFVDFLQVCARSVAASIAAVFFVLLLFTGNLKISLLVTFSVSLVDLYLYALVHYWGENYNTVVFVNIVVAIGLSVDYSAHIAHSYLIARPPNNSHYRGRNDRKRRFKARLAMSQMGSSVFHGGFSTLLAILVLGMSESYLMTIFYKMWVGIMVFGLSNGFFLVPVVLSFVGPVEDDDLELKSKKRPKAVESTASEEVEMKKYEIDSGHSDSDYLSKRDLKSLEVSPIKRPANAPLSG